jgi:hypothetical protein
MADSSLQQLSSLNAHTAELIYTPLEPQRIRTIVLHKGSPEDQITCTLKTVSLHENCPYEALSYAWGDAENLAKISLNKLEYFVTQNLSDALKQLRSQRADKILWVDALCINQWDIPERNQQVREMHLIYSGAERVLAWIGAEKDDVDMVFQLASTAANPDLPEPFAEWLTRQEWLRDLFRPLFSFIDRDYWRRLWVVQELAHAKQAQVICGPYTILYSSLVQFFEVLGSVTLKRPGLEYIYRTSKHFPYWDITKQGLTRSGNFRMQSALGLISRKECRDLRDRLFGIISLFPAELRQRISVDYSVSVSESFASATRAIMETYGSVDIIAWKSPSHTALAKSDFDQLPSWAIDWSGDEYVLPCDRIYQSKRKSAPFFEFSDNILRLRGVQIGLVEHVEIREWIRDSQDALRLTSLVEHSRKLLDCFPDSFSVDKSAYTLTCLCGISEIRSGSDLLFDSATVEKGIFGSMGEISDELDWTIGNLLSDLRDRALFTFRTKKYEGTAPHHNGARAAIIQHFGLGGADLRSGDIVCLLRGFRAPVILRPVGEYYKFISDSYIHSFAEGEAVDEFDGDLERLESFAIS